VKVTIFWGVIPCSLVNVRRFGGTYRLHLQGRRASQARKQQTAEIARLLFDWRQCSSETSENVHHATRRQIPEHSNLHRHLRQNLKPDTGFRLSSGVPKRTQCFGNWICFRPQFKRWRSIYSVGPPASSNRPILSHEEGNKSGYRNAVFCSEY
jgi:hypothetical protein